MLDKFLPRFIAAAKEPYAERLRDRIWWGAGSNATAVWAANLGMNLQSSTLAPQKLEKHLGVSPSHIRIVLALSWTVAKIAPPLDHLFGGTATDS
jgi:alkanesulfonate monooxygenase SsuD/methylene tetrahydromethanopterin reductase-like flavin-dependent oxidoreductase (luciferase family)